MPAQRSLSISNFYKTLVGQTITAHLVSGETVNGTVLDVDAGDVLLQRTGYQDLILVTRHGLAALSAGEGHSTAGAPASTTAEGGAEALPSK